MKTLTLLVALFIMAVGIAGFVAPESLIAIRKYVITPGGLWAIAVLRVGIGLVLIAVARVSRAPRILRALGAVVVVAGLVTPLFGVERARAVLDWEATQGSALIRIGAVLAVAFASFILFAVTPRRRPA